MKCKAMWVLGILIYCAVAYLCMTNIPQAAAGYIMMVLVIPAFATGIMLWVVSALGVFRSPYPGAQRLRWQARQVSADTGVNPIEAAHALFAEAQAQGQTTPKAASYKSQFDNQPRPVLQDGKELKAHLTHIRQNEPAEAPVSVVKPGYDVPAQKQLPAPLTWDELAQAWAKDQVNKALKD